MKCYKPLEACNFFICGHFQDIYSHKFISNQEFTAVKSKVGFFCYLTIFSVIAGYLKIIYAFNPFGRYFEFYFSPGNMKFSA